MALRFLSIALILTLVSGCARHGQHVYMASPRGMSQEARIGSDIHREILGMFHRVQDPQVNQYVSQIGERLIHETSRKDLSYQFIILEDERVYAMHAPGGFIYITTGFFRFLTSEIELAGILAHEIAALQYHDPEFSMTRKALTNLTKVTTFVGPMFGPIGALSALGMAGVSVITNRKKSEENQLIEADRRALGYLVKSGFDPQGLIDPLRRMQMPNSEFQPYLCDYLESHPLTERRLDELKKSFVHLDIHNQNFSSGRAEYFAATEFLRANSIHQS